MSEQTPIPTQEDQAIESLRRQARHKGRLGILVGMGSMAAGFAISYAGVYEVEPQLKTNSFDRAMTELAFIGVGASATAAGGLFAKEIRRQADKLGQQALELSCHVVVAHLMKLPE